MYAETNNWRSTGECIPWPFVGYLASSEKVNAFETSTEKFFGPKHNWYAPKSIQIGKLSDTPFQNYDEFPYGVLQSNLSIAPGQTKKVVITLGMERNREQVQTTVSKYNNLEYAEAQLQEVKTFYRDLVEKSNYN